MTDFVSALARKWCPSHGEIAYVGGNPMMPICTCAATTAACREALEEAEKIANEIGSRPEDTYYDDPNVPWQTVAINIAAAIAALKEGKG